MFEDLLITEEHEIRGKKFVFSEYSTDKYLEHMPDDDQGELKGKAIARHNINFAAHVVALSLAPKSANSVEEIQAEFKTLSRSLQDELYDKAAALNGIIQVTKATQGNVSPDSDLQEN